MIRLFADTKCIQQFPHAWLLMYTCRDVLYSVRVMAYIVMAYVVMALCSDGLCSDGLYSHGLCSYGLYSHGLCSDCLYSDGLDSDGLYGNDTYWDVVVLEFLLSSIFFADQKTYPYTCPWPYRQSHCQLCICAFPGLSTWLCTCVWLYPCVFLNVCLYPYRDAFSVLEIFNDILVMATY